MKRDEVLAILAAHREQLQDMGVKSLNLFGSYRVAFYHVILSEAKNLDRCFATLRFAQHDKFYVRLQLGISRTRRGEFK